MKSLLTLLMVVALSAGAVLAQTTTTTTMVTCPTNVTTAEGICPVSTLQVPGPCAALQSPAVAGDPVILVLGTEERFALDNLAVDDVNARDTARYHASLFSPFNPITSHRPNAVITRHGNPFFPYYQLGTTAEVARRQVTSTQYVVLPASLGVQNQSTLVAVSNRYRTLTPQQAVAMGYQPVGACIAGIGQPYVNQVLVDNIFDPMQPEAFTFGPDGRVLAAHYFIRSDQALQLFGQQTQPTDLVPGTQALSVWLFEPNPRGLFASRGDARYCP